MKMRYPGQNWSLTFDLRVSKGLGDLSFVDATLGEQAIAAFNRRHTEEFGHVRDGELPEITGVRLVASVETPSPTVIKGFTTTATAATPVKTRRANLGHGYGETDVFRGSTLEPGQQIMGDRKKHTSELQSLM